jgi:exodeoxyribonuclease V alpha subunit
MRSRTAPAGTLVIIDEASMLDLASAHGLLRRLPHGARLLLIGDERQLPPVGIGLLFHRFVQDDTVTATLASVRRQASDSDIPAVAAKIRRREVPVLLPYGGERQGVRLLEAVGRETIGEKVVTARADLGGGPDVMVVTPVNDGPCGVIGLNRRLHDDYVEKHELQELCGPLGDLFSAGEPVVHRRNDYHRGLFNGSVGSVKRIDRSQRSLIAVFDNEEHSFEGDELVDSRWAMP